MQVIILAQDALEENFLIRAVDGPVGVEIAEQVRHATVVILVQPKVSRADSAAPIQGRKTKMAVVFHFGIIYRLDILEISQTIFVSCGLANLNEFVVIKRDRHILLRHTTFQVCHPCEGFSGCGFKSDIVCSNDE